MFQINENTIISIAGTVGVGKSTLAKALADRLNFNCMYENVHQNPYLELYYHDFKRWGFHLQVFFLAERLKSQKQMFETGKGYVQDRTIYEDYDIFAKMNYENGTMSEEDWETYSSLFEALVLSPFFEKPDLVIYIDGEFDKIISRINLRGRDMEKATELSYWQNLHKRYYEWIDKFSETKVLRINIDEYDVNEPQSIDRLIKRAEKILNT